MADGAQVSPRRYSAFISYTHRDVAAAKRLQHQLETYKLPARVAVATPEGRLRGRRLKPIFRDISDLSAEHDLSAAIREALAQSDNLIVVCSPRSAQSEWVGREIDYFRALHGDTGIRAAVVDGSTSEALHPALRNTRDGARIEPLAANFTKAGPGRKLAMLKLVAGLAGVELDELIHRDGQRQIRRIAVATSMGAGVTLSVAALGGLALTAQADAERRRTETTGLVEYMLTDLRKTMQRTGRLDQLAALNDGAMQYYRHQDLKRLSEAQLRQRAKLLQAMGEDDEKRGKLEAARESFEDAHRTTAALLAAKPDDPKRIFAHAQSEYWVGFINWRNRGGAEARRHFQAYSDLADRLVRTDPKNDAWLMETAYAANNLGMLALRQAGDAVMAERHFRDALRIRQSLATHRPGDREFTAAIANAHAWLADSQRFKGEYAGALKNRQAQHEILFRLMQQWPADLELQADILGYELAVARIDAEQGELDRAAREFEKGRLRAKALAQNDPENVDLAKQARMFELFKVRTWLSMPRASRPTVAVISNAIGECAPSSPILPHDEIADFCSILSARALAESGRPVAAKAALATIRVARGRDDVLTAHWGLNLNSEMSAVSLIATKGK